MKLKALIILLVFSTSLWAQKTLENPIREQSIIITKEGYYPKRVVAFTGEKVRFFVTSTLSEPSCFIVKGKEAFVSAKKGRMTETEAIFDEAGEYEIYCPTHSFRGKVVVLDHHGNNVRRRSIASEKDKASAWMPKEY